MTESTLVLAVAALHKITQYANWMPAKVQKRGHAP